ncbi:uncharacterized protein BDZ83DRAFT_623353 [Colletotrichum acutatum]|uniref:Uncharacterized protein n=1 Tax=Glomerella acutata TaxID=27357 RepID=A0AAD8UI44_GLOAC|nr:uncharacterized protein BDZ83DRAFT_623353 [Colletotrichum acutatum]KAK1724341.1 hypothetical protein BDZ83DRAFT_623353 [Colletotrichum acutatum]
MTFSLLPSLLYTGVYTYMYMYISGSLQREGLQHFKHRSPHHSNDLIRYGIELSDNHHHGRQGHPSWEDAVARRERCVAYCG